MKKVEIAKQMLGREQGATMDEIIAVVGGPKYNLLRSLRAKGYRVRSAKEGNSTRYWAASPRTRSFDLHVSRNGQTTLPKELRERLGVRHGGQLHATLEDGNRVTVTPMSSSIQDLFGILGKPPRSATLEQMDEAVRQGAVDRYLRAIGRKRR
jgi:antitoxin PrlF